MIQLYVYYCEQQQKNKSNVFNCVEIWEESKSRRHENASALSYTCLSCYAILFIGSFLCCFSSLEFLDSEKRLYVEFSSPLRAFVWGRERIYTESFITFGC